MGENKNDAMPRKRSHRNEKYSSNKYMYIKGQLVADIPVATFDIVRVKMLITKLLGDRFGLVGKSLPIDLLKYDDSSKEVILRCGESAYNRLSSAILCHSLWDGVGVRFRLLKASVSSLGLFADSRSYIHRPATPVSASPPPPGSLPAATPPPPAKRRKVES